MAIATFALRRSTGLSPGRDSSSLFAEQDSRPKGAMKPAISLQFRFSGAAAGRPQAWNRGSEYEFLGRGEARKGRNRRVEDGPRADHVAGA